MSRYRQSMSGRPVLALTAGDPAGIGPEIIEALFEGWRPTRSIALIVGARPVFSSWLERRRQIAVVHDAGDVRAAILGMKADHPPLVFFDTGERGRVPVGKDSSRGGRHAGVALEVACRLARDAGVGGIVTAPLSKRSLNLAGFIFNGHTEFLADFFGAPDCQMMMAHRDFRVVPLTRHIPLGEVSAALSVDKILTALVVVNRALQQDFGISAPRIGVAGLNPHAGEDGLLGGEERETIVPALRRARARRIDVTGPLPADALFQLADAGTFDAFLAMYHDQGLIPFKMRAKRRGVNVTLGLPVVRTSVDHGVAYDIAGRGVAESTSLLAAYRLAERLVLGRRRLDVQRPGRAASGPR